MGYKFNPFTGKLDLVGAGGARQARQARQARLEQQVLQEQLAHLQ